MQKTNPAYPLSGIRSGEQAVIRSLHQEGAMRSRLQDLGIIPGTVVRCLARNKGMIALEVRGTVIALRIRDARLILSSRN